MPCALAGKLIGTSFQKVAVCPCHVGLARTGKLNDDKPGAASRTLAGSGTECELTSAPEMTN